MFGPVFMKRKVIEIEIISAGSGGETDAQPIFTLKIKTDQNHATQLVEMFVRRASRPEGAGPGIPLAHAPSVTPSTLASPTDRMASAAPLPVPTENMSSDEGATQSTPQAHMSVSTGGPHSNSCNSPKRQLSSEQLAAAEGEEVETLFYEAKDFVEVQNQSST
ncbi:hypothetical protein DPEC_G00239240 [Dallia pectoralis]|uniref:Uncharacterized protein n=1 Tax=Dallia pectoralis TaxID=75939 RepID=A0ACC2FZH9_DALPE|nr:hypothetical protein DPEC_G00239240 [Dallia pectoralis]